MIFRHHWPITDVSVPCSRFEAAWQDNSGRLLSLLEKGSNVLIHCKGGRVRAGMLAARLSVERGINPGDAIAKVRAVRDGAVETHVQEEWVKAGVPGLRCRRLRPDSSGLKGADRKCLAQEAGSRSLC